MTHLFSSMGCVWICGVPYSQTDPRALRTLVVQTYLDDLEYTRMTLEAGTGSMIDSINQIDVCIHQIG